MSLANLEISELLSASHHPSHTYTCTTTTCHLYTCWVLKVRMVYCNYYCTIVAYVSPSRMAGGSALPACSALFLFPYLLFLISFLFPGLLPPMPPHPIHIHSPATYTYTPHALPLPHPPFPPFTPLHTDKTRQEQEQIWDSGDGDDSDGNRGGGGGRWYSTYSHYVLCSLYKWYSNSGKITISCLHQINPSVRAHTKMHYGKQWLMYVLNSSPVPLISANDAKQHTNLW